MKQLLIIFLCWLAVGSASAQDLNNLWQYADLRTDSVPGISLKQANDYLKGRPFKKVVVAIIDSGFDTDHDALKDKLWTNKGEIAGNGKDDDGNGYVDDVHGWNFIGGKNGNVTSETLELTREYRRLAPKYANAPAGNSPEYKYWKKIEADYLEKSAEVKEEAANFMRQYSNVGYFYSLLSGYAKVDTLSVQVLSRINSPDSLVQAADGYMTRLISYLGGRATLAQIQSLFQEGVEYFDNQVNAAYNLDFDPRGKVGDNPGVLTEKGYGNNDISEVDGFGGSHGTHVAGIVGGETAEATIGVDPHVEFMFIRAVPSGDERDKDVANAIMYAADNGAQVINMSFGKEYSPDQDYVRKAVKYAEEKGVVMVHAAGNDGKNNDEAPSYPDGSISGKKKASTWIEVGAMSANYNENLPGNFSNYGKKSVDLFAPGVDIVSSIPGNEYKSNNGTSMAAPTVAGVCALLLSYFPELSAQDVKKILLESATPVKMKVLKPGSDELVPFSDLSKTGGILNAYEAVKLADEKQKLTNRLR